MTDETRKNGGPAFPASVTGMLDGDVYTSTYFDEGGMTLRDWFAGQALVGILAGNPSTTINQDDLVKVLSVSAYGIADAMLVQREKPND
jgi:hypothetical protein